LPFLLYMNIIDYLNTIGFNPVIQTDEISKFIDYNFLECQGLFAELHDDNHFYLWVNPFEPIINTVITETNLLAVQLKCVNVLATYRTLIAIKTVR